MVSCYVIYVFTEDDDSCKYPELPSNDGDRFQRFQSYYDVIDDVKPRRHTLPDGRSPSTRDRDRVPEPEVKVQSLPRMSQLRQSWTSRSLNTPSYLSFSDSSDLYPADLYTSAAYSSSEILDVVGCVH